MTSPFEGEIKHSFFKKQIHWLVWIFQVGRPLLQSTTATESERLCSGMRLMQKSTVSYSVSA